MNILALDLGITCGWAVSPTQSGIWKLKPSQFDSAGERFRKFRKYLTDIISTYGVTYIVYEEVHAHRAVIAAQLYGSWVAVLQIVALDQNIEYQGIGVGTIKKHAGKGNFKKEEMIAAAQRFYPSVNIIDDNHADALCLLHYAQSNLII